MNTITYLVPALGVAGLLVMFFKRGWVAKQDAGDPNMQEIANAIAAGALAFLKAEWRVLIVFGIVVSILLGYSGTLVENSSALIGISFLIGAFVSAFAGYIGMNIATRSNVRTTQAARTSLQKALKVSFTGGSVMGIGVASLAVLGLGSLFIVFYNLFIGDSSEVNGLAMERVLEVLAGFSSERSLSPYSQE